MNKDQLYYFVNVVDCGSINKAAEKLYLSQPALSRSIRDLEKEIGKVLLMRSNKGITITPAGKTMYYYAQSIVGQFQMIERLKALPDNILYSNLSISVSNIFLQDDIILKLYRNINASSAEINIHETVSEEVLNEVIQRKSELGILVLNATQLEIFERMCEANQIDIQVLGDSPLYIHVNDHTFPKDAKTVEAKDLLDKTFVKLPNDFYSNLNIPLNIDNITINSFAKEITSSNYHAIIKMIKHEDAFLLGHKWVIDELQQTNIKSYIVANSEQITKYFIIIRRKNEYLSETTQIFLDLIHEHYDHM